MTMTPLSASSYLRSQLLAAGMAPTAFSAWEGWKVFKGFLREPVKAPDEGASVQGLLETDPDGQSAMILTLMRQFTALEEQEDVPFRWVGFELAFDPADVSGLDGLELWSYDFPDMSAFVAAVEAHPGFQAALNASPIDSDLVAHEI